MEGKPGESSSTEEAAPPSVAKLAGLFGDKVNSPRKEAPPHKPTRKKPPCSLPLPKPEATNNGDEKVSPPHTQMPKIKVKSSPLIEKLQANLAFAPASFLPGSSPKSPGLKVMASPFTSPPSTPSSPGFQSRASESSEESPVSFEQPPEGAALPSYTKVRTRGSLKRRPPSRRFRKSQTDMDFDIDSASSTPKENGDKTEEKGAGSEKGDTQQTLTDSPGHETDAESRDPAPKSSESPSDEPAKIENEEGSPGTAQQGEKPSEDKATLDPGDADSPIAKEVAENTEDGDGDGQEKDENSEPSKSDGDDKPEK